MTWCQGVFANEQKRCNYPVRDSEVQHREVERCHDEEIENAVLENGSHQAGHARLAPNSLKLEYEDHEGNESNDVCENIRVLGTGKSSNVDTSEHDLRPVGPLLCVRDTEGTPPEQLEGDLGKLGG